MSWTQNILAGTCHCCRCVLHILRRFLGRYLLAPQGLGSAQLCCPSWNSHQNWVTHLITWPGALALCYWWRSSFQPRGPWWEEDKVFGISWRSPTKSRQCYQKSATIGDYTSVVFQQKYKQTLRKRGIKKPSATNSASSAHIYCYSASAVFLLYFLFSSGF